MSPTTKAKEEENKITLYSLCLDCRAKLPLHTESIFCTVCCPTEDEAGVSED